MRRQRRCLCCDITDITEPQRIEIKGTPFTDVLQFLDTFADAQVSLARSADRLKRGSTERVLCRTVMPLKTW